MEGFFKVTDPSGTLLRASETLTPASWVKGERAVDRSGRPVQPHSLRACRYCLVGAVRKWEPWTFSGKEATLWCALVQVIERRPEWKREERQTRQEFLEAFNDHPNTHFEDVQHVLKEAASLLRENPPSNPYPSESA